MPGLYGDKRGFDEVIYRVHLEAIVSGKESTTKDVSTTSAVGFATKVSTSCSPRMSLDHH